MSAPAEARPEAAPDAPPEAGGAPGGAADPEERGSTTIPARTVERIAARIAADSGHAGGTASRVLGIAVKAASAVGQPEVTARMHGQTAVSLQVSCSLAYPAPVRRTTERLRADLAERVAALTGLRVHRVDIAVTALTTERGGRVQ